MTTKELLTNINKEDKTVPHAVEKAIPQIRPLIETVVAKMKEEGLFRYIGLSGHSRFDEMHKLTLQRAQARTQQTESENAAGAR